MVFGENKPYLYIEEQKSVHVVGGHSHDFCQYLKLEMEKIQPRQDIPQAVCVEILCWRDGNEVNDEKHCWILGV